MQAHLVRACSIRLSGRANSCSRLHSGADARSTRAGSFTQNHTQGHLVRAACLRLRCRAIRAGSSPALMQGQLVRAVSHRRTSTAYCWELHTGLDASSTGADSFTQARVQARLELAEALMQARLERAVADTRIAGPPSADNFTRVTGTASVCSTMQGHPHSEVVRAALSAATG